MPRVETIERHISAPPRPRNARGARGKKPPPPQDRLTQRALFFRRVRRGLKPGLWLFGVGAVIVVGTQLVRSLPSSSPKPAAASAPVAAVAPAGQAPTHPGLLANLLAGLGLRVTRIVTNGAVTTDPGLLAQAIGVNAGDPTFGFSLTGVQQRVQNLGPVQTATVERVLPGTLVVNITERDVYAVWQTVQSGQVVFELIDKKGNVITDQDAVAAKRRQPSLLLLSGADAPGHANQLIPELQAQPAVLSHVAAAERVDGLRWNLLLKDQTVVKLPADDEAAAIAQLAALQASMQLLDRPVEAIDLRQAGRLVVRPYATAPADEGSKGKQKTGKKQEGQ